MYKALRWVDDHVLFILSGFLLAFIPLFPKLPLFDALPGYIVRVRLEDFLVVFALVVWLVQLWRKKASFGPNPLAKPILAYLTVGVLSMISAIFITRTVPFEALHVGKMFLHFLRRVEYFSLFFVFYSSVKSLRQVKIYLLILLCTVVGVTLYGYGQKYLYWPAFSTMNREFSKGWALYLTQHARVLSTFGGHYDLAAFTMTVLIILWAIFFSLEKIWLRIVTFLILSGAFWLLILTASRTSFIAYIVGVTILFVFWMLRRGLSWAATRWLGVVALSIIVMLSFGDLSDRFTKLLKLDQRIGGIKSLLLQPIGNPPQGQIALLENNIEAVTSKSDFPPLPMRPVDVANPIAEGLIATQSASGAAIIKEVPRTYSQNALVYDLSTGIRLDALWPRAIAGFRQNILLGTGYSTLTKTQVAEFTEAESTDNDYLRALGETGLLGFLAFGWILVTAVVLIGKNYLRVKDRLFFGMLLGAVAAIGGLLVNAVYIDVFESSKVAYSFWALMGIVLGGIKVVRLGEIKDSQGEIKKAIAAVFSQFKNYVKTIVKSEKTHVLALVLLALILRHYKIHQPLADWHSWRQADTSAVTRNFVRYGLNPLFPRYDDLSSVASGQPNPQGYRFVEFPLYNVLAVVVDKLFPGYDVEYSGRLTSVFVSLGTLALLYLLVKLFSGKKIAWLAALFFAVLPYNIYWSRVILPEPTLVFLTTAGLYFFAKWTQTDKLRFWSGAVIFFAAALLVKFTAVFFIIPGGYLVWRKWGKKIFTQPWLYVLGICVTIPFLVWRWHIGHYPEGIPAYTWLFNGNGIRFKGAWFWWLFAERIAKLILGGWGILLFGLGVIRRPDRSLAIENSLSQKTNWFFHAWLVGLLLYLAVFATGNVQHDYYQIILVPLLCVFLAIGAETLLRRVSEIFSPFLSRLLLVVSFVFMLMFGWYQVRDYFNINHPEIVEAGGEFNRLIPNLRVRVIAPYNGDTAFLYQTGKQGWPLVEGSIKHMITLGADYYISTNYDDVTNELLKIAAAVKQGTDLQHTYKVIKQTDKYVIIQLVPDRQLPRS